MFFDSLKGENINSEFRVELLTKQDTLMIQFRETSIVKVFIMVGVSVQVG
jgi:hypothetical protein